MSFEGRSASYLVQDALRGYSADARITSPNDPLTVSLNGQSYLILLNLTHESGANRPEDESRIQLNAHLVNTYGRALRSGRSVLVCGYEPQHGVYTAWEAEHALNRNPATFSIYSRFSGLEEAQRNGISTYEFSSRILGRRSKAINFLPEYLGMMLENQDSLFLLDTGGLREACEFANNAQQTSEPGVDSQESANIRGEAIEVTRIEYPRNPQFRRDVMAAYNNQCCICGTQLGLVDAAHIIPHSEDKSDDTVNNGVALCANHHRAYDSSLLLISNDYTLAVNDDRAEYLIGLGIDKGLDDLKQIEGECIELPDDQDNWPDPDNLKEGCRIRKA